MGYDRWKLRSDLDDAPDWDEPQEDDEEEPDVDTCLGCGRAYSLTPYIQQLWRESFNYREGAVIPQLCHRCMRGDPPPHEY